MERLFLSRTQQNRIEGPFTQEEVRARLEQGKLTTNDEISASAGYWFYLHERDEVVQWLGRPIKKLDEEAEEATMTMSKTLLLNDKNGADPSLREEEAADPTGIIPRPITTAPTAESIRTEVARTAQTPTSTPTTTPTRTVTPTPASVKVQIQSDPLPEYSVEAPAYWRYLVVLFIGLLLFVVYRVFGLPNGLLDLKFR
ncbi:MAG: hypothetical protein EOP09_18625 [Proteobacteria bacterium]|nr:MAG: hypothetical protein EOP09_18625 [Pseudomonadota bacterium]